MTNIASKFGLGRGGIHFNDPREFERSVIAAGSLRFVEAAGGTTVNTTSAGGFTEAALRGVADDTNWTSDTYKTLLNVSSGSGLVWGAIGPTGLAGTPTTTFRITVDGTAYTVAVVASTTGQRALLGAGLQDTGTTGAFFTTAAVPHKGPDSTSSDKTTNRLGTGQAVFVPPWMTIRAIGTPCLIYRTSLLVEAKSSESNSTTTNQERQAAVIYKAFS